MGERERLVKVCSESELRVGMLVVVKGCLNCGGTHRHMLLNRTDIERSTRECACHGWAKPGWSVTPKTCGGYLKLATCSSVAQGRLFRVVDGLKREANPYIAAPVPRKERTRG